MPSDGTWISSTKESSVPLPSANIDSSDTVRVLARIRPLVSKEKLEQSKCCIRLVDGPTNQLIIGKDRSFTFDYILSEQSSQEDVYETCVQQLVDGIFEGYNATVLAYGQTGSGKTFTMGGYGQNSEIPDEEKGVIPRVIAKTFEMADDRVDDFEFWIQIEYLEIYNEEIRDLLHPEIPSKQITIREKTDGDIIVNGIKAETARNIDDVFRLLSRGNASRSTGVTLMNEHSSRSHAIFTTIVQSKDKKGKYKVAKFHLVDLAGSERAKRTGAVGDRFKESVNINQGLLALGNVISALGDDTKKGKVHVPYRQSKLTRMLQSSLGGNSKTLMIACLSPADSNFEESLSTLKYANRARNIKNRPIINIASDGKNDSDIIKMQDEIAFLQQQLSLAQSNNNDSEPLPLLDNVIMEEINVLKETIFTLQTQNTLYEDEICFFTRKADDSCYNLKQIAAAVTSMEADRTLPRALRKSLHEIVNLLLNTIEKYQLKPSKKLEERLSHPRSDNTHGGDLTAVQNAALTKKEIEINNLRKEVKDLRDALACDEEIFERKNEELCILERKLKELESSNHALLLRIDVLEKSGQLWQNPNHNISKANSNSHLFILSKQKNLEDDDNVLMQSMSLNDLNNVDDRLDHRMNVAKESIELQKKKIDDKKEMIEQEVEKSEKEYVRRTMRLDSHLKDLEVNIKMKEDLIRSLSKSEQKAAHIAKQQCERLQVLEEEIKLTKQKLQLAEHRVIEHKKTKAERDAAIELRNRERLEFEEKIKAGEMELQNLKRQQVEYEKLTKLKERNEKRIDLLNDEISKMRGNKEGIKKKMDEEQKNYRAQVDAKQKEISNLQREAEVQKRKIKELELSNDRQRQLFEKKTKEWAVSQKKNNVKRAVKSSNSSRSSYLQQQQEQRAIPRTADGNNSIPICSNIGSDCSDWFERTMNAVIAKRAASVKIRRASDLKEVLGQSKRINERRFSDLTMHKLRGSAVLKKGISELSSAIADVDERIRNKSGGISELELRELALKREKALDKMQELKRQEEREDYLNPEENQELYDLREELDAINAKIEYNDELLSEAKNDYNGETGLELIFEELDQLAPLDSRNLVKKCCEMLLHIFDKKMQLQEEKDCLELQLNEKKNEIQDIQSSLHTARLDFDRRLITQQKEHESQIQSFLINRSMIAATSVSQSSSNNRDSDTFIVTNTENRSISSDNNSTSYQKLVDDLEKKTKEINSLEKTIRYYKSFSQELKSQLQTLCTPNVKDDIPSRRIKELEDNNIKLIREMENIKGFLRSLPSDSSSLQAVRIAKSELREVPQPLQESGQNTSKRS